MSHALQSKSLRVASNLDTYPLPLCHVCNANNLSLTLSSLAFEKGRKVWGALSAPVRKPIKELTETPCCYLEF